MPPRASCAFLRNLCLDNVEMLNPDDDIFREELVPQSPCEPLTSHETSGNATRERLAAQIAGNEQAS